jgi:hypothetical protein
MWEFFHERLGLETWDDDQTLPVEVGLEEAKPPSAAARR